VTVGGEEAEKNERSKVTETKIRSNAEIEEKRKSGRSNTTAQPVTSTTVSFSPSSSPYCNTREEEEACASPQTGRSNSSKHCPPPQRRATVCSHQCHLKPPSTTTSPPLEVEEEKEKQEIEAGRRRNTEKIEQRRNRTTVQQHITDSFSSRKNRRPPGKPPFLFFFFFLARATPLFTLHVNSGEFSTTYFYLLGRAMPAQPTKNQKNIFGKFVISPRIFYCILINIGLYFYTVKIQIRY
jgi:hypothetical protein